MRRIPGKRTVTEPRDPGSRDALVVGGSRGIGLALTEALLASGQAGNDSDRVFVTYRGKILPASLKALATQYGQRMQPIRCELADDTSIAALGDQLREANAVLALTLHAAGILHEDGVKPEKALSQAESTSLMRLFEVNSIAPLLVARTVLPLIPRSGACHFAALSAMVGSIGDNRIGGWYGYRASKAALNQFLKTLAIEARRTHPGLCVTSIHPGTTDTDLSKPFQGNVPEKRLYTPEQSAQRILDVVMAGTPETSGRFMNWNGEPLPW